MKIIIIGCPGAGKSSLTRRINEFLCYPVMHLDKVYHLGNKAHITREDIIKKVTNFANTHHDWIIDGNYISTLEMRADLADTIVFLNIPSKICLTNARNREAEYIKTGVNKDDIAENFDGIMTAEFVEYIKNFEKDTMPKIKEILKEYSYKNVKIINNYTELEDVIDYFKIQDMFPKVFYSGYIKEKLETDKYKNVYYDLVDIEDWNAGPFYTMYEEGNCDYVFGGNHEYFQDIKTIDDFSVWCNNVSISYIDCINSVVPANSREENDRELLLKQATKMDELFNYVIKIQRNRIDKGIVKQQSNN